MKQHRPLQPLTVAHADQQKQNFIHHQRQKVQKQRSSVRKLGSIVDGIAVGSHAQLIEQLKQISQQQQTLKERSLQNQMKVFKTPFQGNIGEKYRRQGLNTTFCKTDVNLPCKPRTETKRTKQDDEIIAKLNKLLSKQSKKTIVREPDLLQSRSQSNLQDRKLSPEWALHKAQKIIHQIAIGDRPNSIVVTNQNEVVACNGIHGQVAQVGLGFGTGRHTATFRSRLQTASVLAINESPQLAEMMPKKPRIKSAQSRRFKSMAKPIQQRSKSPKHISQKRSIVISSAIPSKRSIDIQSYKPYKRSIDTSIQITPSKPQSIQTLKAIKEPKFVNEPIAYQLPLDSNLPPMVYQVAVDKPLSNNQDIDYDWHDWYESAVYDLVHSQIQQDFISRGIMEPVDLPQITPDQNLNPLQLPIFSLQEAEYLSNIAKSKILNEEWFLKAKTTCEVLVANMVHPDVMNHIFFSHYISHTQDTLIKLLLRVQQLYHARSMAMIILANTVELSYCIQIVEPLFRSQCTTQVQRDVCQYLSRQIDSTLQKLNLFNLENNLYSRSFIYKRREVTQVLGQWQEQLNDYLNLAEKDFGPSGEVPTDELLAKLIRQKPQKRL